MGADPTVRAATAEDLDGTRSVARAAWHEVYDDLPGERTVDRMLSTGGPTTSRRWASDASATGCSSATRWGTPSTGTTSSTSAGAPTSAARRAR